MLQGPIIANADPTVLVKSFLFILFIAKVCIWWRANVLMTNFLKIYPNILPCLQNRNVSQHIVSQPLYRDTYRIARFLPIHSTTRCVPNHHIVYRCTPSILLQGGASYFVRIKAFENHSSRILFMLKWNQSDLSCRNRPQVIMCNLCLIVCLQVAFILRIDCFSNSSLE